MSVTVLSKASRETDFLDFSEARTALKMTGSKAWLVLLKETAGMADPDSVASIEIAFPSGMAAAATKATSRKRNLNTYIFS